MTMENHRYDESDGANGMEGMVLGDHSRSRSPSPLGHEEEIGLRSASGGSSNNGGSNTAQAVGGERGRVGVRTRDNLARPPVRSLRARKKPTQQVAGSSRQYRRSSFQDVADRATGGADQTSRRASTGSGDMTTSAVAESAALVAADFEDDCSDVDEDDVRNDAQHEKNLQQSSSTLSSRSERGELARPPAAVAMLRTARGVGGKRRARQSQPQQQRQQQQQQQSRRSAHDAAASSEYAVPNGGAVSGHDSLPNLPSVRPIRHSENRSSSGHDSTPNVRSVRGHPCSLENASTSSSGVPAATRRSSTVTNESTGRRQSVSTKSEVSSSASIVSRSRRESLDQRSVQSRRSSYKSWRSSTKYDIDIIDSEMRNFDSSNVEALSPRSSEDESSLGGAQSKKRSSFAESALSSLVAVFNASGRSVDLDELDGDDDDDDDSGVDHSHHGGSGNGIDTADDVVDALVVTDDEDDAAIIMSHQRSLDVVPAPVLPGDEPATVRSTVLGTGQNKFLPGASVRRHASRRLGGEESAAGNHSLGAYGAGAAEAAERAASAAAELETEKDRMATARKKTSSRNIYSEEEEEEEEPSSSSGMQVDFPAHRRRASFSHDASRGASQQLPRRSSMNSSVFGSVESCLSSTYYETREAIQPQSDSGSMVFGSSPAATAPTGPTRKCGDDEPEHYGCNSDNGVPSSSSSSSSSFSFESMSIDSDDIDPSSLVAQQHSVPSSFISAGVSDMKAVGSINPTYLDAEMAAGIIGGKLPPTTTAKFAAEHKVFLRAVLQLLAERDRVGVEANLDDPICIKSGSLKKSSTNIPGTIIWKNKFVEIRRGIFSYYEDKASTGGDSLKRRNIPLRTSTCTCRAVKIRHPTLSEVGQKKSFFGGASKSGGGGFAFELSVQGGSRRLWMASSDEERQAWIRAIHEAMLGASSVSAKSQTSSRRSSWDSSSRNPLLPWALPPKDDVAQYLQIQTAAKVATSEAAYLSALSRVWGQSLQIPMQRIREQAETFAALDCPEVRDTRSRLELFWDELSRNAISLNGHIIRGHVDYGPEQMIGALTRCILEYDKEACMKQASSSNRRLNKQAYRRAGSGAALETMSEVQAIGYARDVLLGCNHIGTGRGDDDSFYSVETLCGNNEFVVLIPISSQVEPVVLIVSDVNEDESAALNNEDRGGNACERSGWVEFSGKSSKNWRKRFCVLSEGTISLYENGHPRPHGLKEQLVLVGASVSATKTCDNAESERSGDEVLSVRRYMISIRTRESPKVLHHIAFDNSVGMMDWSEAIKNNIESCSPESAALSDVKNVKLSNVEGEEKKGFFRGFKLKSTEGISEQESPKGLLGSLRKSNRSSSHGDDSSPRNADQQQQQQDDSQNSPKRKFLPGMNRLSSNKGMTALRADKYPDATVRISSQASTVYKLCTANPSGDETKDTWGVVRSKLFRNYLLSGGPNGRLIRGEDTIEMEFIRRDVLHAVSANIIG